MDPSQAPSLLKIIYIHRWVSSPPFGIPFCLPVPFWSSQFIICKWIVHKDFSIVSTSFQNLFVVDVTWKKMWLLNLYLLLYWNEMNVYQFNYDLKYWFSSIYSRVRNKHSPMLIDFVAFFQRLWAYSKLHRAYFNIISIKYKRGYACRLFFLQNFPGAMFI